VIGRARDADLLLSDPLASRQHLLVRREGADWRARDGGSKRGSSLEGAPLDGAGRCWRDGEIVHLGDSILRLTAPLDEALGEAFAAAEVRMRPEELALPPPGGWPAKVLAAPEPSEPDVTEEEEPSGDLQLPAVVEEVFAEPPSGRALGAVDAFVALVALGLLSVSAAGLYWVLH
jgi:pSer/pThr/pTyr-binding forkhead associated (FHA) protein